MQKEVSSKTLFRQLFLVFCILSQLALSGTFLGGCSTAPVDENDPKALMKDAEDEIASEHYQIAQEKLKSIKNKFPYSKQAIEAHLRMADVYFLQESYAEAAAVYETFADLHPKHEKTPYALFRLAKSHFNDIPSPIARDLTPATRALEAYEDFMRRFPSAPEKEEAVKDITHVKNLLAQKELYVGDFYKAREFYDSAKPRYEKIIELYPETETATKARDQLEDIKKKRPLGENHGSDKTGTDKPE